MPEALLYILHTADSFITGYVANALKAKYLNNESETYNFHRIFLDQDNAFDLFSEHIEQIPFFDENRLFVIYNFENIAASVRKKVLKLLEDIPDGTRMLLLLSQKDKSSKGKKAQNMGDFPASSIIIDPNLTKDELLSIIKIIFKKSNREITPSALSVLMEYLPDDLSIINNEIAKLVNYASLKKKLDENDIKEIVCNYNLPQISKLVAYISKSDALQSLKLFYELIQNGHNHIELLSYLQAAFLSKLKYGDRSYYNQISNQKLIKIVELMLKTDIALKTRNIRNLDFEILLIQMCKTAKNP